MANVKITDLTAYTDAASTDVLPIVDVGADITKKISISNLLKTAPLGTAAAPGIAFDGDPNTGVYSPGADQVAISTNGTGRLFVASDGKVGIGNSSPSEFFTVEGNGYFASGGSTRTLHLGPTTAGLEYNTDGSFRIKGRPDAYPIQFYTNNTERMRLDSSGRLGLGTSSPGQKLTVVGADSLFDNPGGQFDFLIGDGNVRYYSLRTPAGAANLQIRNHTANTTIATFTSGGSVGIGTAAPSQLLHLNSATAVNTYTLYQNPNTQTYLGVTAAGDTAIYNDTANRSIVFSTNGTERGRWDPSGRFLVGTSTARGVGTSVSFNTLAESTAYAGYAAITNRNDVDGAYIALGKTRGTSVGSNTAVQANDILGAIIFGGADGTDVECRAADITCNVDGTPGSNDMPGRLVFSTTADGASGPTERMRLSANGAVRIPFVYTDTTATAANVVVLSDGYLLRSTSSRKYKTDIETIEDSYSDALLECRPVWYRSVSQKDNPEWGWWGFIAEEVAEIDPRLVIWKTTEVVYDDKGSASEVPCDPQPEGVAYDRFVPHLLNLIKRQKEQIEAMEARLSALEAA